MRKDFGQCDPAVVAYATQTFRPEDALLREVREDCLAKGLPAIQLGSFDALHLEVLVRMSGAKKAVEIGTLGGYSGISILRGMGPGGRLYTLELDPHHADVAKKSFAKAGFSDSVEILIGPALENLSRIAKHAPFDLVFIDADKANYPNYLSWATDHLRMGGTVIGDNTFGFNRIQEAYWEQPNEAKMMQSLRQFNETVASYGRYRATILPTAEGLTVAVKVR